MTNENSIYSLLKAKFLIEENSLRTWKFLLYLFALGMFMVYWNHKYDEKNYKITKLNNQVKELRSRFIDTRSELNKLRMESSIAKKMESKMIYPSNVPPKKIVIQKEKEKSFFEKLWQ